MTRNRPRVGHLPVGRFGRWRVPPSPDLVVATLQLMARQVDQIPPTATPVLVDLRRGVVHRPDATVCSEDVEWWLAGEATAFATMWSMAA
jgi:hypothetical protein